MKRLLNVVGLGMLVCLLSGCGNSDRSPQIVCDLGGKVVPTGFTFAEFQQTLATEHGQVEATGYEQLKTASLVVYFKPLTNGTVLAERAVLLQSGKPMPPAVLFGLTNAVRTSVQTAPPEASPANVPASAP
jgi:hypothetical protein